ncbi:MAG: ATP-binding protein [Candidatus Njordarchaeales archaeon]
MSQKCIVCKADAIVYIPYARAAFCREHFIKFYKRKILNTLKDAGFKGGKVLIGVSGGKDSVALLHALSSLRDDIKIEVAALYIDLGIGVYSSKSLEVVRGLEKALENVSFYYFDIKENLGFTIPETTKVLKRPACAICGSIKRWVLNKFAYEHGFDYVATGHNIDDIATFYLKALLTQRTEDILRGPEPLTPGVPELRLVGRLRPQFFLSERENMLYVNLIGLSFIDFPCPLSRRATLFKYKGLWENILSLNPVAQINFVKTILDIKKHLTPPKQSNIKLCKVCGYPTTASDELCFVCRLRKKLGVL